MNNEAHFEVLLILVVLLFLLLFDNVLFRRAAQTLW